MKPVKSTKLRNSARDRDCTMQVAGVCCNHTGTTVLAHVNTEGGCMGGKSPDFSACFACRECHAWLDQNRGTEEDRLFYTRRAMVRTWRIWINEGILCLK